jgi:SAM-dependent methyltransferase
MAASSSTASTPQPAATPHKAWSWQTGVSTEITSLPPGRAEWAILSRLAPYETILEIGCGKGRYTGYAAGRQTIVGLEYTKEYVDHAARHVPGFFLRGDGFNVPLRTGAFDAVFSTGVIEHFDDPATLVREHVRVCREGGTVLIAVPANDSPDARLFHLVRQHLAARGAVDTDWHLYGRRMSDRELRGLMEAGGLEQIELVHAGTPLRRRAKETRAFWKRFVHRPSWPLLQGMLLGGLSVVMARRGVGTWLSRRFAHSHGYNVIAVGRKPSLPGSSPQPVPGIESYDDLYSICICPRCRARGSEQRLEPAHPTAHRSRGGAEEHRDGGVPNRLDCLTCHASFPVTNGAPALTVDDVEGDQGSGRQ